VAWAASWNLRVFDRGTESYTRFGKLRIEYGAFFSVSNLGSHEVVSSGFLMKRVGFDLVCEPVVREHQRVKLVHVAAEFSIPVNRIHLAEGAWIVADGIVNPHSLS
jgi:hypothetical protein